MLEKNYKLAEMIFLEQVMGERRKRGLREVRMGTIHTEDCFLM